MTDSIRKEMWEAMESSPYVMVKLNGDSGHSEPMAAQLDEDADGHFWFYTTTTNRIAPGGPAMVQFVSKGHDLFCCIAGTLVEERDPAVIDRYWSNAVEAWYEGGRNDPTLKMMRFELKDAEVWAANASLKGMFKLLTGKNVSPHEMGSHKNINLESAE